MAVCKICEVLEVKDRHETGVCAACRRSLGIRAMPPPRRPAAPCQRCSSLRFVRVVPREVTTVAGIEQNVQQAAPMALSYPRETLLGYRREGTINPVAIASGVGVLETYVCTACGFVEWYCQDPDRIPIGPEHMSDIVDFTPDSPYR